MSMTLLTRHARGKPARAQLSLVPPAVGVRFGEIEVDLFAGGGGASEGIARALGRGPAVAVNHDPEAIALHTANHPETRHYQESVWQVDPHEVCDGRPVGLLWLSPDCKHFSKAKGAKPVNKRIRSLAWVACRWATAVRPRVIMLENVEEFVTWGPCIRDTKGKWRPDPKRKGQTFRRFVARLRRLNYEVAWRELRACDFGAPTIRKRLFLVARCDGEPIVWPTPTHGPKRPQAWRTAAECIDWSIPCPSIFLTQEEARAAGLNVKRPLCDNTLRRIAAGLQRFVLDNPRPFVVPMQHNNAPTTLDDPLQTVTTQHNKFNLVVPSMVALRGTEPSHLDASCDGVERPLRTVAAGGTHMALVAPCLASTTHAGGDRVEALDEPARTVTCAHRGEKALIVPSLVQYYSAKRVGDDRTADVSAPLPTQTTENRFAMLAPVLVPRYGERQDQAPRAQRVDVPLSTIVPTQNGARLVTAFMAKHFTDRGQRPGSDLVEPLATVTTSDHNALVTSHLMKFNRGEIGQRLDIPAHTVTAHTEKLALVRAFLVAYYGSEADGQAIDEPTRTVTTKDRLGIVTVQGADYQIVDIGMRMLSPRELYRAQGFGDAYRIDIPFRGKPLSKTAQVRMCGNSVPPDEVEALVRSNYGAADVSPLRRDRVA